MLACWSDPAPGEHKGLARSHSLIAGAQRDVKTVSARVCSIRFTVLLLSLLSSFFTIPIISFSLCVFESFFSWSVVLFFFVLFYFLKSYLPNPKIHFILLEISHFPTIKLQRLYYIRKFNVHLSLSQWHTHTLSFSTYELPRASSPLLAWPWQHMV